MYCFVVLVSLAALSRFPHKSEAGISGKVSL